MSQGEQSKPVIEVKLITRYAKKARKIRQATDIGSEILETMLDENKSIYRVGSGIELTEISNSDMDFLLCDENFAVVLQPSEVQDNAKLPLMLRNSRVSPGYVELQIPNTNQYFAKNLENPGNYQGQIKQTGPALKLDSNYIGMSADFVGAFRCKSWPPIAVEWITRERKHGWPSPATIKKFKSLGCFLVHVGSPPLNDSKEWRISFSLQERELMFGLNEVQHQCYVVLKRIKQDFLLHDEQEKQDKPRKSISSYHCKTCLFYTIERNSSDIWVPKNLKKCVQKCLVFLLKCVLRKECPNFFVASENMFAEIQDQKVWEKLEFKLEQLITGDVSIHIYLNNGSTVQLNCIYWSYIAQIMHVLTYSVHTLLNCLESLETLADFLNSRENHFLKITNFFEKQLEYLNSKTTITDHTPKETKSVIDLVVPFIHTSLASHIAAYSLLFEHAPKKRSFLLAVAQEHFNIGVSSDLTSGCLKRISFMLMFRQYNKCLEELISLKQLNCWSNVIHVSPIHVITNDDENHNVLSLLETKTYSRKEFIKSFCSACICFLPTEVDILPFALKIELFSTSKCNCAIIDSQIYMYFLWYLTCKKMNKTKNDRLAIIHIMEQIVLNMNHLPTAYNLIAWACAEEGFAITAMGYFFMSLKQKQHDLNDSFRQRSLVKTHGKSAIWHILIFLWQLWFTDLIPFCLECFQRNIVSWEKCPRFRIEN